MLKLIIALIPFIRFVERLLSLEYDYNAISFFESNHICISALRISPHRLPVNLVVTPNPRKF